MVDLAAIGRAQPSRNIRDIIDVQQRNRQLDQADRAMALRETLAGQQMAINRENLLKLKAERERDAKMSVLHPWETGIGATFYGGPNGKVSQWALKKMTRMGLIENINGIPAYTGYAAEKAGEKLFSNKDLQIELLTTIHSVAKSDLDEANRILAEKPQDKNALQTKQNASEALDDTSMRLDQLSKAWKTVEEKKAEEEQLEFERGVIKEKQNVEQQKLGQKDRQLDIMAERNRILANAKRSGGSGKGLEKLEDDIRQVVGQIESKRAGQDIMSEAFGSEKRLAVLNLERQLNAMLKSYIDSGGNPERVGFPAGGVVETGTIIVNKTTGERLQWDGANWQPLP